MQIVRLLKQALLEWYQSRAFEIGAALAFYAIFSIAPVIVLAFTAASLVLGKETAQGRLSQQIESTVGHTVATAIQATAQHTYRSGSSVPATVLSIIFFGFGATGLFSQLQIALNAIWEVEPKSGRGLRGNLYDRFGSFLAVLGISALLLADLLVTAVLSSLGQILPSSPASQGFPLWRAVMFALSWAFLTLAIALVYRILPDAKIAWRDVWVGAGSSGLLFLLGNHLIGWYLVVAGITSVYGAAGSIVIVLLWVYYSSQVLLFGAAFTRVYAKHRGAPLEPKENAVRVSHRNGARMVGETKMNQRNASTPTPPDGVAKDMGELKRDIVSLAELQFELFKNDCRKGLRGLLIPVALLLLAGIVAAGSVPVALIFIGEILAQAAGLSRAAAFSIAALGGFIAAAALGVAGWSHIRGVGRVFERSREELTCNMTWIKQVVKRPGPTEEP